MRVSLLEGKKQQKKIGSHVFVDFGHDDAGVAVVVVVADLIGVRGLMKGLLIGQCLLVKIQIEQKMLKIYEKMILTFCMCVYVNRYYININNVECKLDDQYQEYDINVML